MGKVTYMKDGKKEEKTFGTDAEGNKIKAELKKAGIKNPKFEW